MKVLVTKLSSLGDLFSALPAVHNLKVGLDAEIDWVTQCEYVELVRCFTDVRKVIPFDRGRFWRHLGLLLGRLRAEQYDYAIDFQGLIKSAFTVRAARAGKVIGPSFHRECSRLLYNSVAGKRNKDRLAVDENLDVVGHLGLERVPVEFPVRFPDEDVEGPAPRVAMVPVSRWHTKNWPIGRYVEVARHLSEKGAGIFVFGGPHDVEACAGLERALDGRVVNLAGKSTLVQMGSKLQKMDLVISNDSGPLHMAVALGIPTVSVYGATDPRRTGPYGEGNRVLSTSLPCQPCLSRKCKVGGVPCLTGITSDEVTQAVVEVLG